MEKRLVVAVDTGFDGSKIVVNGQVYHIPFVIQDITDEVDTYELRRADEDYVRCVMGGRTYLIGKVARTYLFTDSRNKDKRSIMESFYTMERYKMPIFEVALDAFIAYGLSRYAIDSQKMKGVETFRIDEIGDWDVYVGVALPHKYVEELVPDMESYLKKDQKLEIYIGDSDAYSFNYKIADTFYNSQIVSMLINEVVDDEGNDIEGESVYDKLPALVLDGGYKTFGEFEFAKDQSITGDDSNLDYAMININAKVAAEIAKYTPGYNDYMIDELYHDQEIIHYQDEEGVVKDIDVVALKDRILKEVSADMIEHLLDKYKNLLKTKMILVGGGTGSAYYPYIKEFCENERKYLSNSIVLAGQRPFFGKKLDPVFAVVCGLYKDMLMQLNAMQEG